MPHAKQQSISGTSSHRPSRELRTDGGIIIQFLTRRSLLLSTLSASTLSEIAAEQQHARTAKVSNAAFAYLSPADAPETEALAAQIIPSDDGTPGAQEAACIHFIDRALATFDREQRDPFRIGLAAAQKKRAELFPSRPRLPHLKTHNHRATQSDRRHRILQTASHAHGNGLAAPAWGGNQNHAAWAHIGMEHKMAFQPPFGFYDAEVSK